MVIWNRLDLARRDVSLCLRCSCVSVVNFSDYCIKLGISVIDNCH